MKPLSLILILILLSGCASTKPRINPAEAGIVYIGMPKEDLEIAGYSKYTQVDYYKKGDKEWFYFQDWTTKDPNDIVIFQLRDGKVESWEKTKIDSCGVYLGENGEIFRIEGQKDNEL